MSRKKCERNREKQKEFRKVDVSKWRKTDAELG